MKPVSREKLKTLMGKFLPLFLKINLFLTQTSRFMNIFLSNAVFIDQKLEYHQMETFHVCARMIRQIHIPDNVSVH